MNFPLKLIPFVSPTEENVKETPISTSHFQSGLSASEACNFYDSIISLPSSQSSKTQSPKNDTRPPNKTKSHTSSCISKNSIFRLAQEGNLKQIKHLVDNEYPINQQDGYGWTPLMCATCAGHEDIVRYLIDKGSSIETKCKQGMTALDIAMKSKHYQIVQLLQGIKIDSHNGSNCSVNTEQDNAQKYCDVCKSHYMMPTLLHERSIAHLFNTKKTKLSTFYHIPENNRGFQLMLKSGWDKDKGLGLNADGRKFPIKTVLKKDRTCIGRNKEVSKVTHFNANDKMAIESSKQIPVRTVRERTLKKWQRRKLEQISRQREINFRRQFNSEF